MDWEVVGRLDSMGLSVGCCPVSSCISPRGCPPRVMVFQGAKGGEGAMQCSLRFILDWVGAHLAHSDVHLDLERDIADFLGTESSILYSQGFSTISSVIPAFCKRGDIIVADRAVNFAIQKGIQISRSTVRWYDHNDLRSLEE